MDLFRARGPRWKPGIKRRYARYEDGATDLTHMVRVLALVSTDWLHITHALFRKKLESIRCAEMELSQNAEVMEGYACIEAIMRSFCFSWKILNGCGYRLAEAERVISMRHEAEAMTETLQLRENKLALQKEVGRLKASTRPAQILLATTVVNCSGNITTTISRLPTELIAQIISHALHDAHPDYLIGPPPTHRRGGCDECKTLEEYYETHPRWQWETNNDIFDSRHPRVESPFPWEPQVRYHDGAYAIAGVARNLATVNTHWLQITYRLCKGFFSTIYAKQRNFWHDPYCARDREDHETLLPSFWYELKILNECQAKLAEAARMVSERAGEEFRSELEAAERVSAKLRDANATLQGEKEAMAMKLEELQERVKLLTRFATRSLAKRKFGDISD
jgi:hypothetical protein